MNNLQEIAYLKGRLQEMRKDYPTAGEGKKKFLISFAGIVKKRIGELEAEKNDV